MTEQKEPERIISYPIDCRSCKYLARYCVRIVECNEGDGFVPVTPIQLWRTEKWTPTHKRRARTAQCIQYDGENLPALQEMMPQAQLLPINGDILVRRYDTHVQTIRVSDWLVKGEDGRVTIMPNAEFNSKYEEI